MNAVQKYMVCVLRLWALALEGKRESAEADAVRDASDEPWSDMTTTQRSRMRALAATLNEHEEWAASQGRA